MELPNPVVVSSADEAVGLATHAQRIFQSASFGLRKVVIAALRVAAVEGASRWAQAAVEETGMGRVGDKVEKNLRCARETPGWEALGSQATIGDQGLTLREYAPFGVVVAVTPSNNPVATIISNALGLVAAGNAVIFAPHPAASQVCREAIGALAAAAVAAGGPAGLITTVWPFTNETTQSLLEHPGVSLHVVTGGSSIVRLALATGKVCKTIAAGPGNPPTVVDESALFPQCVEDIVTGASFDNNLLCVSEKEVIVVEGVGPQFLGALRSDPRAHELTPAQLDVLATLAFVSGPGLGAPELNRHMVGRDAAVLARMVGLEVPATVRVLWAIVGPDHPFVRYEQLMPVLPVTFVVDFAAAQAMAVRVEGGNHHSASIHSQDIGRITALGRALECSVFVNNAPILAGLREASASMSIGTPTGDGITTASNFVRPLQFSLVGSFRIS